jgi:hypothetical protein
MLTDRFQYLSFYFVMHISYKDHEVTKNICFGGHDHHVSFYQSS